MTNETTVNATIETANETVSGITKTAKATKATKTTKGGKKVTKKANVEKENKVLTIQDVDALYKELKIGYGHKGNKGGVMPEGWTCKGAYRIMLGGSSVNVNKKEVAIYSTVLDATAIDCEGFEGVTIAEDNTQDSKRPFSVRFKPDVKLLKKVLKIYAMDPENKVKVAKAVSK